MMKKWNAPVMEELDIAETAHRNGKPHPNKPDPQPNHGKDNGGSGNGEIGNEGTDSLS